jgi:hypothetical protein
LPAQSDVEGGSGYVEKVMRGRRTPNCSGCTPSIRTQLDKIANHIGLKPLGCVTELLRALELNDRHLAEIDPAKLLVGGLEGIGRRVIARVR